MKAFLHYIQKLALVFWLGEMLFFISSIAPMVFKVLPREWAAKFQQELFLSYFNIGLICGGVLILTFILRKKQMSTLKFSTALGLCVLSVAAFAYCRFIITPELTALQSEVMQLPMGSTESPSGARFQFLHQLSVQMNAFTLLALLVLLALI